METEKAPQENTENLIHTLDGKSSMGNQSRSFLSGSSLFLYIALLVLGIGTGYYFANRTRPVTISQNGKTVSLGSVARGQVFGSADAKTFRDSAEGVLKSGGIEGEGAYHLERPGGESQNVYLTSSVIDLSALVSRKIKVWGETNAAKRAGWLMDVGRAQVLD